MLNQLFRSLLVLMLLGCGFAAPAQSRAESSQDIQRGNILHAFCWSAAQIVNELPNIQAAGFTAVQISPIQGNASQGAEWYYAYLPYDLALSGSGAANKASLENLCNEAHKLGIKIIVDVVANHMNGSSAHRHSWWSQDDHLRSTTAYVSYGSREAITQRRLGDYPDVNSEHPDVQERAKAYVQALKDCGVDGIRWDAAKHIGLPSEACDFWKAVTSVEGLYHYGEILDSPGTGKADQLMKEYTDYMSVTDDAFSRTTLQAVKAGGVPSSNGKWSNKISPEKVVYWGESHDWFANDNGESKLVAQDKIDRAWAILACRKGAAALYFSRPQKTERTKIFMGVKGSTHFTAPEIAAVNHFRLAMGDRDEYYATRNGVASITRKDGGAVIVVGKGGSQSVSVPNGGGYCPEGIYVDKVSGNTFTVTASTISGTTGECGIAVLYDGQPSTDPMVVLTPEGGQFKTPTLEVGAELRNATSGWVRVDGGSQQTLSPGANTVVIGQGVAAGSQIKLEWSATGNGMTMTGSATYVKIDPTQRPADMPASFYVLGEVNGNTWDPSKGVKMDEDGACFVVNVNVTAATGYFSFASELGSPNGWTAFNAKGVRYGAPNDTPMSVDATAPIEKLADPKAYSLPKGEYELTVDWNAMTLTVSRPSGIADVEVEAPAVAPEYFTLQGIRVEGTPSARGLYIKREGSKTTKVIVR